MEYLHSKGALARAPELFPLWREYRQDAEYRQDETVLDCATLEGTFENRFPWHPPDFSDFHWQWYAHPDGVMLVFVSSSGDTLPSWLMRQFFVNGQEKVGEVVYNDWPSLPNQITDPRTGSVIKICGDYKTGYSYALDGQEIHSGKHHLNICSFTANGLITRDPYSDRLKFNGEDLPYEVPRDGSWFAFTISGWHDGVIVQEEHKDELIFVDKNGTSVLCQDAWFLESDSRCRYKAHPRGVMVNKRGALYFNSCFICDGITCEDEYDWHPQGVIVRRENRFVFFRLPGL